MKRIQKQKAMSCILAVALSVITISPFSVLAENTGEITYNLANNEAWNYVETARELYKTDAYADYTTSIVGNYSTAIDKPNPAMITWDAVDGADSYTLTVSSAKDFNSDEVYRYTGITDTSYNVYNLKTNAHYYWKVESNNGTVIGPIGFNTANTVRYINVEKSRNIRDIGGWNGLNQGLVYRGSELNDVATHNLGINAEGIRIFKEDLGIRTDLDLRQPEEQGTGNITESPLGSDIRWINVPITGYEANIETGNNAVNLSYMKRFKSAMAVFSDINNYPVYLHCWGGADRTGTVAFMLEGLSGASEEDLAIDYELTSFSPLGSRFRYNQTDKGFTYANMIAKIKEFDGETLQEKFENYAVNLLGLTKAQVSNIQSILSGNGVVFKNEVNDGEGTGIIGKNVSWTLENLNGHTIKNVTFNEANIEYNFDNNTLTLNIPNNTGDGQIIFDDGNVLKFNGVNIGTNEYVDCNVAGKKGVTNVGRNAESLITMDFAQNMDKTTLTNENIKITNSTGKVIAYEPYSVTEKSYSIDLSVLSNLSKGKSQAQDLPQGDTYTVTIEGVKLSDTTEMAKTSFTFTTDLVLPIAYKEGSYIEDVSDGKNVEALNGIAYDDVSALWGMLGNITDRAVFTKIRMNHAIKEQTDVATLYDTDKPTYKLDLGGEYTIAGMALTTIDAQTKSDWRMCNTTHGISKTETQSMSGVTECINIGNSFMATSDTTFFTREEAPTGRYVYGAPNSESGMKEAYVGLSEIYVWAYMDIPKVTSNVDGKTGITNVGADSVGLIKVDFGAAINTPTSDNITLYVDGEKVEDYKFTATKTGITIDPMYFSTFNAAANSRNIYPTDETKCSISINGITDINNVDLGEYTFDFTSGVILPIAYKENARIENVALGVTPILAEGVTENKHNRGNKETVTDGVLYNNTWQGMFSPTFAASVANQVIYSLDLGAEYDIAGIAISGDDKGSSNNNFYAVGCDNASSTETMSEDSLLLKLAHTNSQVDYIGYNPSTKVLTENEVLSNFSINNNGRYIHVGTSIANRTQVTASEIMVWAYVDVVDVGISSNVAEKTGITNIGENSVGFVTLDFEDEVNVNSLNNVKIINPKGESVSYKPESATSTSYKIDLKYFSTLSSTKSAINDYDPAQSCGTFKIVIDGVKTLDGKYVEHKEISFETGLILPVSYKEGYIIENVALGKLPKLLGERKADGIDNEAYVTDGRQIKDEWKVLREHVTEGNAAFVLDLGAKYNIAGVAIAGVNSSYYDRRQLIGGSNDGTKTIMSDTTNYVTGLIPTVDWNQIIGSFYDYGKTEAVRYIYAGSDTTCLGCRELYVWAYIEKSVPEIHFVNTADEVKVESRNAEEKTLILAWYNSTNEMIGAVTSQMGTVKTTKNTDYKYKAFLWNSFESLNPLVEAIEY